MGGTVEKEMGQENEGQMGQTNKTEKIKPE